MRQKGHGVTHFAELHRVPHKASLSGVAKGDALFSFTAYLYYFSSFFAASFLVSAAASASVSSVSSSTGAL